MGEPFVLKYPVWILAPKGEVEQAEIGRGSALIAKGNDGKVYLNVFTKESNAIRYLNDCGANRLCKKSPRIRALIIT